MNILKKKAIALPKKANKMRKAGELAGNVIGPGLVAEDIPQFLSRSLITGPVLLHPPKVEDPFSS